MKELRNPTALAVALISIAVLADLTAATAASAQETYRLVEVAGQPLPVVTEDDDDCQEELVAATLTLTNGTWALTTTQREVCGNVTEEEEDRDEGTYLVDGQTLHFLDEDGDSIEADDDDEGEIDVEDLAIGTRAGSALMVRLANGQVDLLFRI